MPTFLGPWCNPTDRAAKEMCGSSTVLEAVKVPAADALTMTTVSLEVVGCTDFVSGSTTMSRELCFMREKSILRILSRFPVRSIQWNSNNKEIARRRSCKPTASPASAANKLHASRSLVETVNLAFQLELVVEHT